MTIRIKRNQSDKTMKETKTNKKAAEDIMASESEFKGYTIEEIRFHRALVAMEADFCKTKILKTWSNIQKVNPLSPSSGSSLPTKAGSVAMKLVNGLNYMDYILLGASVFSGVRKVMSFFRRGKKK